MEQTTTLSWANCRDQKHTQNSKRVRQILNQLDSNRSLPTKRRPKKSILGFWASLSFNVIEN